MKRCAIPVVLACVPCLADGVYTGRFNVNLRFLGKAITVRSANGPAKYVIDMGRAAGTTGFIFEQGEGPGKFTHDPMLAGPFPGDYRPLPGSPLIDAGDTPSLPGSITTDLNGDPRRVDDPATPDTGVGLLPVVDVGAFDFQADTCCADYDVSGGLDLFDILCFVNECNAGGV